MKFTMQDFNFQGKSRVRQSDFCRGVKAELGCRTECHAPAPETAAARDERPQ